MGRILGLRGKIRAITCSQEGKTSRPPASRDPELAAIIEIARRRKHDTERGLEVAFGKARPILERVTAPVRPVKNAELPPDFEARVRAMPDPEQRIRAIVEFKLSSKSQSDHHD